MDKGIKDKGWGCAGNFHHYHFWIQHSCSDFFPPPLQKSDSVMCMVSSLLLSLSRKTLLTMLHTHWQFVAVLLILSVPDPTQPHPSSFLPFLLCVLCSFFCFQLREGTPPILSENNSEKEVILENVLGAPPLGPPFPGVWSNQHFVWPLLSLGRWHLASCGELGKGHLSVDMAMWHEQLERSGFLLHCCLRLFFHLSGDGIRLEVCSNW